MKFVWEDKENFIKSIWDYSEEEIYYSSKMKKYVLL